MASPIFSRYFFILFIQYYLILVQAAGGGGDEDLIFEDGYTVSTVLDGDKSNLLVNPQSILHQSPPSDLFIILDSAASTLYTASLPTTSNVLGTTSAWLVGVGLSCLISLAVGFVIRPYLMPYDGVKPHQSTWTWTHWQMSLERQVVMLCSDMRSVVVNTAIYLRSQQIILLTLSHLSLMFRRTSLESHTKQKPVSLLDLDLVCNSSSSSSTIISARVSEQLKDLLTFDEGLMTPVNTNEIVEREERKSTDYEQKKIDGMILANLVNFEDQAPRVVSPESPELRLGVVRRR